MWFMADATSPSFLAENQSRPSISLIIFSKLAGSSIAVDALAQIALIRSHYLIIVLFKNTLPHIFYSFSGIELLYEIAPMVLFRTMYVKLTFSCTKILRFRTIKLKRPLHRMREYMIFSMQSTPQFHIHYITSVLGKQVSKRNFSSPYM